MSVDTSSIVGNSLRTRRVLNEHLKKKKENSLWLGKIVYNDMLKEIVSKRFPPRNEFRRNEKYDALIEKKFPYQIYENTNDSTIKHFGSIDPQKPDVRPSNQSSTLPDIKDSNNRRPVYEVMVPIYASSNEVSKITDKIEAFKTEAFGDAIEDEAKVKNRLAVIFGVNRFQSLDWRVNACFREMISSLPQVEGLSYRVNGFTWQPKWVKRSKFYSKNISDEKACFRLVSSYAPNVAEYIRKKNEGKTVFAKDQKEKISKAIRSQVPFQQFRQHILESDEAKSFFDHIKEEKGNHPFYFCNVDGDYCDLGRFLRGYDNIVKSHQDLDHELPSVVSTGYQSARDAPLLLKLAMKLDMVTRIAMAKIIPNAPYYPEPNIGIDCTSLSRLAKLSFLNRKSSSNALEARRIVENAIQDEIVDEENMVFVEGHCPRTPSQAKMMTENIKKTKRSASLNIKQKQYLKTCHGFAQSHAFPSNWNAQIYNSLPFEGLGNPQVFASHLTKVYHAFDAINLICEMPKTSSNYNQKLFDNFIKEFSLYYQKMYQAVISSSQRRQKAYALEWASKVAKTKKELKVYETFFMDKVEEAQEGMEWISEKGVDEEWQENIYKTAKESGLAVSGVLKRFSRGDTDFLEID